MATKPIPTDIVGKRFGRLTVIKPTVRKHASKPYYWCKCACGNEKEISRAALLKKLTISCGCALREKYEENTIDLTGQPFGKLRVIGKSKEKHPTVGIMWDCICECGNRKPMAGKYLNEGSAQSCGCMQFNRDNKRKENPFISNIREAFRLGYADGNLTVEEFAIKSQENCTYCGIKPQNSYNKLHGRKTISAEEIKSYEFVYNGLDRIDPNQKHNPDNVVACCKRCNTAKLNQSLEEFDCWFDQLCSSSW